MTRQPWLRVAASTAAILLTGACGSNAGPVGELHQAWHQADDPVVEYVGSHASPILIRDQSEFDAWQQTLPAPMQSDVEDITLDEQVAVVGYYGKCKQVSSIQHLGDGELRFDVSIPPEDEGIDCAWSPLNVELWIIGLDELGVDDPGDILLEG